MKFLSVRKRPPELGSFPMEFIDRSDGVGEHSAPPKSTAEVRDDVLLARCAEPFLELASSLRDADVVTERAPLDHSPEALARQMKAAAYFLDTSMVGICDTDDGSAMVLLIEYPRLPEKDNPARAWIEGAEHSHVALRGSEVANTLAGYLRWLGYPAKAHFADASDVDLAELAVDAGLAEVRRGQLTNPFVGAAFGLAAVTTGAPLMADRPLDAKRHRIFDRGPGYWFGRGGAVSGLERLKHSLRPTHLSRYPMERIRRVKEPTTLIREDEVPRVPSRAGFFSRAAHGDLGDKAKREVPRFAGKHPFAESMEVLMEAQLPLQDGATAPRNAPGLTDPEANARAVKSLCYALGADLVGICEAKPYAWYSHDPEGKEIEPDHRYAIVMLFDQGYATMEGSSGDDWISGAQSYRAYMRGGQIGSVAAAMLRDLGHDARCHSAYKGQVLQIPLVLLAGLGELSRIGELVLNPFVGPRFKSAVITTDLPLTVDRPVDFGLQDMCSKCMKCARECPSDAISWGDKVMFNGYEMWKPDVERCVRYRVTNPKGSSCGRCMKTCPYNHEGLLVHNAFLKLAIAAPWSRSWIARMDDKVGNGRRVPLQKWWSDLEIVDGRVCQPRGANKRELEPDKVLDPGKHKIAYYPASVMPRADQTEPVPIDRKAALAVGLQIETARQARCGSKASGKAAD